MAIIYYLLERFSHGYIYNNHQKFDQPQPDKIIVNGFDMKNKLEEQQILFGENRKKRTT